MMKTKPFLPMWIFHIVFHSGVLFPEWYHILLFTLAFKMANFNIDTSNVISFDTRALGGRVYVH